MSLPFTYEQVALYFERIGFHYDGKEYPPPTLDVLKRLITLHLSTIPFENLSIHYNPRHNISIEKGDVFEKLVLRKRGGYCMELNSAFANLLRTLGYSLITGGARVLPVGTTVHLGWAHQTLYVTIDSRKYLVDVGFGGGGLIQPIEILEGVIVSGVPPESHRVVKGFVGSSTDSRRQWSLQHRKSDIEEWSILYSFDAKTEFFVADYTSMNFYTSTAPEAVFVNKLMMMKVLLDDSGTPFGRRTMLNDKINEVHGTKRLLLCDCQTEEDRVQAIAKYWEIFLTKEEGIAIAGRVPEIKHAA